MAGEIKNFKSTNHKVDFELDPSDPSRGILTLDKIEIYCSNGKDFVLSIEDSMINTPTALVQQNIHNESVIIINMLPDLESTKIIEVDTMQEE